MVRLDGLHLDANFGSVIKQSAFFDIILDGPAYVYRVLKPVLDLVRAHDGDAERVRSAFSSIRPSIPSSYLEICEELISDEYFDDLCEFGEYESETFSSDNPVLKALYKGWEDGVFEVLLKGSSNGLPEGVARVPSAFPDSELREMNRAVDRFRDAQAQIDYHPGSENKVRDILHPSMFPYIGAANTDAERETFAEQMRLSSGFIPDIQHSQRWGYHPRSISLPNDNSMHSAPLTNDDFARIWRGSRYQWMPTEISVDESYNVKFVAPINGVDTQTGGDADVSMMFESLLKKFIPMWENVLGYTKAMNWPLYKDADDVDDSDIAEIHVTPVNLKGRILQVIPKIADVVLSSAETHEGVWHVEGLSHEHIVATGIAYLKIDTQLKGGSLLFRRSFRPAEYGNTMFSTPQNFAHSSPAMAAGLVPLGSVTPGSGELIAFPNSHQHKLEPIRAGWAASTVPGGERPQFTRRLVVFFLVDPENRTVSTLDVDRLPQHVLDYEAACKVRLAMMQERKAAKANLNSELAHNFNFCEH
eukprot:ANDGO_07361.mRNA.1 hypothetical protein SARC_01085